MAGPWCDRLMLGALRAAYGDLVPRGRHPLLALFIDLDPHAVDVNVHPTKAEVRFRDAAGARSLIIGGLRYALEQAGHRASAMGGGRGDRLARARWIGRRQSAAAPDSEPSAFDTVAPASGAAAARPSQATLWSGRNTASPPHYPAGFAEALQCPLDMAFAPSADTRAATTAMPEALLDRPLGAARAQLHGTYIVAETRASVVIVDQHAAHERLVYERMKAMLAAGGVARQGLLIPEIIDLEEDEVAVLVDWSDQLAELGLALEAFGPGAVIVREVPALLGKVEAKGLVHDLLANVLAGDGPRHSRTGSRRYVPPWPATAACARAAALRPRR